MKKPLKSKAIVTAGVKEMPNTNNSEYVSPTGGYHATIPWSSSNCLETMSRTMNVKRYRAAISMTRNRVRRFLFKLVVPDEEIDFFFRLRSFPKISIIYNYITKILLMSAFLGRLVFC